MRHQKIIKRDNGDRVRITVELVVDWSMTEPRWTFVTHFCEPKKRTWKSYVNHDDFSWRSLDRKGRHDEDVKRSLKIASKEEVLEAMNELWHKVKPSLQ